MNPHHPEESQRDRVERLQWKLREGEISAREVRQLRDLLMGSREARQTFLRTNQLECLLETVSTAAGTPSKPLAAKEIRTGSRRMPAIVSVGALAAGVLFFIGLGIGTLRIPPSAAVTETTQETTDDGIALLTRSVDAVWKGEAQPVAGSILSAGKLQLVSGLAQIEFYSGARVILDSGVDLELVSSNEAICHKGRLRAYVPPAARGFSVKSPRFELVDLGTEFAMDVGTGGEAQLQVFDGEVELYPPDGKRAPDQIRRLVGGAGLSWQSSGATSKLAIDPASFPSFDDVRERTETRAQEQLKEWREWNRTLPDDPRIAVRYDFEGDSRILRDSGSSEAHGSIIGCEWTNGRWADKGALEFKRPSDRVRVNIPGEYDQLTMTAWVRADATPERLQGLLLTDGYEQGHVHWQLAPPGGLRLGVRIPGATEGLSATGYGSPPIFTARQVGVWSFIATVYDRRVGMVRHYLNGREISSEAIQFDQPLSIGSAEIGNWGVPLKNSASPVRNFVGRIDELTVWKVALGVDELREIHGKTMP